jgi:hypothetical protein
MTIKLAIRLSKQIQATEDPNLQAFVLLAQEYSKLKIKNAFLKRKNKRLAQKIAAAENKTVDPAPILPILPIEEAKPALFFGEPLT